MGDETEKPLVTAVDVLMLRLLTEGWKKPDWAVARAAHVAILAAQAVAAEGYGESAEALRKASGFLAGMVPPGGMTTAPPADEEVVGTAQVTAALERLRLTARVSQVERLLRECLTVAAHGGSRLPSGLTDKVGAFLAPDSLPTDGHPCEHIGCLGHRSHPCEGCGRLGGRGPLVSGWIDEAL